ncbi:XRE family transcriptional regulator [Sesbania bispinosa]|nr:XRE family transcriptional regulator [Sesbania bispinosa]
MFFMKTAAHRCSSSCAVVLARPSAPSRPTPVLSRCVVHLLLHAASSTCSSRLRRPSAPPSLLVRAAHPPVSFLFCHALRRAPSCPVMRDLLFPCSGAPVPDRSVVASTRCGLQKIWSSLLHMAIRTNAQPTQVFRDIDQLVV